MARQISVEKDLFVIKKGFMDNWFKG